MLSCVIVEDNYPVRKGLEYAINRRGDITVAGDSADGTEGVSVILSKRPDIIITDIRLPGKSGLEMLDEISHADPAYRPQAIIISAYSEFTYAKEAIRLGVIAYLVKPIDKAELNTALDRALGKAAQGGTAEVMPEDGQLNAATEIPENEPRETVSENAADIRLGSVRAHYAGSILRYIKAHYAENIRLSDIAGELNLSENYISRIFREETGYSIGDYRISCCIAKAAHLLEDPRYKVFEVADLVGISDQRYFSKLFRQKTGMTPASWRDMRLAGRRYQSEDTSHLLFLELLKEDF